MKIIYKDREFTNLGEVPIPFAKNMRNARALSSSARVPLVKTRIGEADFVVCENQLFPSREGYAFGILMGLTAKELVKNKKRSSPFVIADVGTGVGTHLVAIGKQLIQEITKGRVMLVGTDIDGAALNIAEQNVELNGINGVFFRKRDVLKGVASEFGKVDMIISNPPWHPSVFSRHFSYFPSLATDGGVDGMDFYKRLLEESEEAILDNGVVALRTPDRSWRSVFKISEGRLRGLRSAAVTGSLNSRLDDRLHRHIGLLTGDFDISCLSGALSSFRTRVKDARLPGLSIELPFSCKGEALK